MTEPTTDPAERTELRATSRRGGFQPRAILFVAVAWVLLWDRVTWGNILSGLLVGLAVTLAFPLPSIDFVGRPRPLRVTWLVLTFLTDLVRASVQVTRLAFSRRTFRNAVIEVPLRTTSDFYLTITAELNALVPGSVVLEARRSTSTIYLHLLDVDGPEDVEAGRAHVYAVESRVVRALGSDEEIAQLERGGGPA
jgi:multicomponent Na+:H+ antiporter subunit E